MSEIRKGDIVQCWPGTLQGRSYAAVAISDGVVKFGGTDCWRVRQLDGYSDYLAVDHVQLLGRVEGRTAYVQTGRAAMAVCDFDIDDVVIEDNAERLRFTRMLKGFR